MNRIDPHPTEAPLFADLAGDFSVSFEFFPPKTEKMDAALWEAVQTLAPLAPRFVSVTYGADGEVENGLIYVQLKATDKIGRRPKKHRVPFRVLKQDVDLWEDEPFPVYLVLFDAIAECAH